MEDIRQYDAVKARKEKTIPFKQYLQHRQKSMPEYQIRITKTAQKQLDKLPDSIAVILIEIIQYLSINSRLSGCKKLKGRDGYRIWKGDFRIIYDIDDKILTIEIIAVGNRKNIYD